MLLRALFLTLIISIFIGLNSCGNDNATLTSNNKTSFSDKSDSTNNLRLTKINKLNLEGNEIGISQKEYNQNTPKTIYLSDKNLWFTVWADESNQGTTGIDIYGIFIKSDGSLCGNKIQLTNNAGNETNPTIAYKTNDKIVLAWQDSRSPYIYIKSIDITTLNTADCSGTNISVERQIPYSAVYGEDLISRSKPFIKYDNINDRFLLTFVEKRDTLPKVQCTLGSNPIVTKDNLTNNYIGYATVSSDLTTITSDIIRNDNNSDAKLAREVIANKTALEEKHTLEIFNDLDNPVIGIDTTSNNQIIVFEGKREKVTFTCTCDDTNANNVCDAGESVSVSVNNTEINSGESTTQHIYGLYFSDFDKKYIYSYRIDKDLTNSSFNPDIAFDPYSKRFLTVFENITDTGNTKIYGQLINSGAGIYNNNILISYQDADENGNQDDNVLNSKQTKPAVSFDSVNGRFFVAWEDSRNSSVSSENLDIYGQYIDSEGSLRGKNYVINDKSFNQRYVSITFNTQNQQYLAVWQDARNAQNYTCGNTNDLPCGSDIYGQRFTVGQPQILVLQETQDQNGNTITIPLQPPILDFGVLDLNSSKSLSIRVKNTGDTDLKIDCITEVSNNLLGTVFKFLNLPTELSQCNDNQFIQLAPSTYLRLTILFEPLEEKSYLTDIKLLSDAVQNKEIKLTGSGSSTTLEVDTNIIDFGTVYVNQEKVYVLNIKNTGSKPVNINSVLTNNSDFTTYILGNNYPVEIPPGANFELYIKYNPQNEGLSTDTLTVNSDTNNLTVYLKGSAINPQVSILYPENLSFGGTLDFGQVQTNTSKTIKITLKNNSNSSITLQNIDNLSQAFSIKNTPTLPLTIDSGATVDLLIEFSPTENKSYQTSLNLLFDFSPYPYSINLTGTGSETSTISMLSIEDNSGNQLNNINFGKLLVGDFTYKEIIVKNTSNTDVIINSISLSNNTDFYALGKASNITLSANQTTTLKVFFSPTKTGNTTSKLIITDNNGNTYYLDISGEGYPFKVESSKGTVEDFQELTNIPALTNKPENLYNYKAYSFIINTGDNQNTKTIKVSLTFLSLPSNPVVYKVDNDGNWTKISNIEIDGNTISYEIEDNGSLDLNNQTGIIEDPIVVGTEQASQTSSETSSADTQTPPVQTSSGGCSLSQNTDYSLLTLLIFMLIMLIRSQVLEIKAG